MVWVKICGMTNLEDAQAAVDAGADALGFVFAVSPRHVAPAVAREITRALPDGIEKVGVFVNESAVRIREVAEEAGLTGVQLHGDEILDVAAKLAAEPGSPGKLRVIPVYPIRHLLKEDVLVNFWTDRVLFDTAVEGKQGGTGQTWDWKLGKAAIELLQGHVRVIVAGGLTPVNVADAVRTLHPWGVDVSSGVEREPGKKDHEKVRAFVKAAKGADL